MSRKWTEQQKDAIASRGGSILVSAAAGSGKTAVLVKRVIERITDQNDPCPANELLIVTFTKAAAGEMRDRIYAALKEKIRQDPNNSYLRRQEMLLPDADICTIDSFCNSLVKENFRLLDISPDFKIVDNNELSIMESAAIDTVMENEYQKGDKAFIDLVELLFKSRDDTQIAECIKKLYSYSRAYAFPDIWLDSVLLGYNSNENISESCWGKAMLECALQATDYCLELNDEMQMLFFGDKTLSDVYCEACKSDEEYLRTLKDLLESGKWDEAKLALNYKFKTRGRLPGELKEDSTVKLLNDKRDTIKSTVSKKITSYLCVCEEDYKADADFFFLMVDKLIECVKAFGEELLKLKKEKNSYDFSDISHMALDLLIKWENDKIVKTPLALEISKRYVEILIDEYQDTNQAQHLLFLAVSKNESNIFRVGDAKQSIYSFRQAMPEIFTDLRDSLEDYTGNNYPAKITLDKNFRSREGVVSFVNFVFSQIMSKRSGGVEYNMSEELVAGAEYPITDKPQASFHIVDTFIENAVNGIDPVVCQARHIASVIKDMVASERTVGRSGEQRPIQYKDICILMRSINNESATTLADELRRWDIPCFTEVTGSFFSSSEISVMLSILRITDNPNQDIPLLSALMSPIFAFSPDETAKLRIADRKASLYSCLLKAESKNSKVADFLKFFRRMRFIASTCTTSELIRRILDETSYLAIVQAMSDGALRRSNLMLLIDYAEAYERSGMTGLSGFIRFIDKLFVNKKELDASNPISENANVVRIMTIHKSKGLEFPVCILAYADKNFNEEDEKKNMILHPSYGVGLVRRDERTMAEYETLPHMGAKMQMRFASRAEEMRILYVALTRAKEEIIIVTGVKNAEKAIAKAASEISVSNLRLFDFVILSKKSYGEWLLRAVLRHPDASELRELIGLGDEYVIDTDSKLEVKLIDSVKSYNSKTRTDVSDGDEVDDSLQKLIDERVNFKYKYAPLASIATKRAASQLDEKLIDRENFASSKPDFMSDGKMSASQKGTATHKFMQYADFEFARNDISAEAKRLVDSGKLTQDEAANIRKNEVEAFFDSKLYERIRLSKNVMREKKFTVNVPAESIYPSLKGELNEDIMVQGMTDCVFEENGKLVIVDYKTDRIEDEDVFRSKYTEQLRMYKYALEQITGIEVSETCLYSFKLSKIIEIF